MNTAATLKARLGTLRFTVLGYEYPNAESPADCNWLVARVEWDSASSNATHEGAILEADELRDLAAELSGEDSDGEHRFLEPNFSLYLASGRISITLNDAVCEGAASFQVTTPIDPADVIAFGEALRRIAQQFPPRGARPARAAALACPGLAAA